MAQLVVIGVDDPARAQTLLIDVGQLAQTGALDVVDAVIVTKSADGRTHALETTDMTPIEGGLGGAFWGLLLGTLLAGPVGGVVTGLVTGGAGALLAKLIDRGIPDEMIREMQQLLDPGHAAVCVLAEITDPDAALAALAQVPGTLVWSVLPDEAAAAVTEALAAHTTPDADDAHAADPRVADDHGGPP